MRTKTHHCQYCVDDTKHATVGMVPSVVITDSTDSGTWQMASMCVNCGTLVTVPPENEEILNAQERIVNTMVECSIMTDEEADQYLNP